MSVSPSSMTEPEPDLGSSSPLLAETNPPLPLGLLMANGRVLCSKHISPWLRVGLACPAPSWHGVIPALLRCLGRARGVQQVLLSPIPGAPAWCWQEQRRIQTSAPPPPLWHDLTRYVDTSGREQSYFDIHGTKPELQQPRDFGDSHPGLAG